MMKVNRSVSPDRIYWISESEGSRAKGPYTLQNLRELGEYGHVTRTTLVRVQPAEEFCPLERNGDLLARVFPERRQLKIGVQYQSSKREEEYRPVRVRDLVKCDLEAADDTMAAERNDSLVSASNALKLRQDTEPAYVRISDADNEADALNPRETLRALAEEQVRRRAEDPEVFLPQERSVKYRRLSLAARLMGLALFASVGMRIWLGANWGGGHPVEVVIDFLSGTVLIVVGLFLMLPELLKVATAPFDVGVNVLFFGNGRPSKRHDLSEVDRWQQQGDLEKALEACRDQLAQFPRVMSLHLKAVRLCLQLGWKEEAEKHYRRALKKITCGQDRNLFLGNLRKDGYDPG